MSWRIHQGDCRDVMEFFEDGAFDLICTDPPYGIPVGAAFVRGGNRVDSGAGGWNATADPYAWIAQAARLLAPGGHLAAFVDRATGPQADAALRAAGLTPWAKFYLVKLRPPPTPRPTFVSAVEECLIAEKRAGKRRWYGGGYTPNRWIGCTPGQLRRGLGHPAEKPVRPVMAMVKALSPEGGRVLDPFAGVGTTGEACLRLGRSFVGVELDPTFAATAERRLAALGVPR